MSAGVRAAVKEIDPAAAVGEAVTMRSVVDGESAPWRFLMRVFVAFALVAAALAIVGLGAVVTLNAAARHRELAIRAALGAGSRRLRWLVLREAVGLTGLGRAAGPARRDRSWSRRRASADRHPPGRPAHAGRRRRRGCRGVCRSRLAARTQGGPHRSAGRPPGRLTAQGNGVAAAFVPAAQITPAALL